MRHEVTRHQAQVKAFSSSVHHKTMVTGSEKELRLTTELTIKTHIYNRKLRGAL